MRCLERKHNFKIFGIFGVVNVYSATFSETFGGLFDFSEAIGKQLIFIILSLFNKFYPLRVSPVQEELGLNIAEHNAVSIEHDLISILDKSPYCDPFEIISI